jgi:hypothetical protein
MSPTIMDRDCVTDHLWEDGTGAAPGTDYFFLPTLIHQLHFFEQFWVNIWPFLY